VDRPDSQDKNEESMSIFAELCHFMRARKKYRH
jgi:hypothetical protein